MRDLSMKYRCDDNTSTLTYLIDQSILKEQPATGLNINPTHEVAMEVV